MTTWNERMASRRTPPAPQLQHVATLFRVVGHSGRPMRCAAYLTQTGTELRLEYEHDDDLVRSQLFVVHNDDAIAELADRWHAALIQKGFEDLEAE